jgi:mono/diheme cytochrome c family protein
VLQWLQVFGRFHMLVLHVPIGLLAGLATVEFVALVRGRAPAREVTGLLAWLVALSAGLAASMGYVLSFESEYAGEVLMQHLYFGVGLAGVCVLTALLHARERRAPFRASLLLALILAVPTGHLGGTMTHGEGFLTKPLHAASDLAPVPAPAPTAEPTSALALEPAPAPLIAAGPVTATFASAIAPIFESRCSNCHGQGRAKGGLALYAPETISVGGKHGPIINAGEPASSELLRRLRLPVDQRGHMPPRDKPQPSREELAAIEAWITAGASFDASFVPRAPEMGTPSPDQGTHVDNADPSARARGTPASLALPSGPASGADLAALRARLAHVEPVERGSNLLWIDFAAAATSITDDDVESLLAPVRAHVAELSLSRARITDRALTVIAAMPNLRRLELRATGVTDAGVAALRSHPRLEELVLAQTHLTDASVENLAAMPALTRVNLWRAGVSGEGAIRLSTGRGSLVVELGDRPVAEPLQAEDAVRLTGDAPPPSGGGDRALSAALKPVNTVCPVLGKPIDPDYVIVYRGRVIGFCCRHCAEQFWTEPAKFEAALGK